MFSQKEDELEGWMKTAEALHIVERDSCLASLKNDLAAVKHGICLSYNNGLAEGERK